MRKPLDCIRIRQIPFLNCYPLYFQHVPVIWHFCAGTVCLNISQHAAFWVRTPRSGFLFFPLERIGFKGERMIGWHIFCSNGNRKEVRLAERETDDFEIKE
jgi:hypothetical protein